MLLRVVVLVALASATAHGQDAAPAKAPQLQTGLASFQERMKEIQEENRQAQEANFQKINTSFNELVEIWKDAMASAAERYKRARLFNNSNIKANNDLWNSFFNWLKNLLTPVPLVKDEVTLLEKPNEDPTDKPNEIAKEVRALLEALKALADQQQEKPSEEESSEESSEEESSEEEPSEEEPSEEPSEEEPSEEEPSEEQPSEEQPSEEQPSEPSEEQPSEEQNTGGSDIPQPFEGDNEAAGESEAEQPESQEEKQEDEEQQVRPREEVVEEAEDVQLPVSVDEETARLSAIVADSLQRAELTMLEIEAAVQAAVEAGLTHGNFRATEKSNDFLKELDQLTAAFASSNADAAAALADIETKAEENPQEPELISEERKKVLQKWLLTINIYQVKLSEISIQVAGAGVNITPAGLPNTPEGLQPRQASEQESDNPFE